MGDEATRGTASALTVQMLEWLSSEPRTYAEAMDAWRTSCPRLSVWEDAIADGLLQVVRTSNESRVSLTARGTAVLGEASALVGSPGRPAVPRVAANRTVLAPLSDGALSR